MPLLGLRITVSCTCGTQTPFDFQEAEIVEFLEKDSRTTTDYTAAYICTNCGKQGQLALSALLPEDG